MIISVPLSCNDSIKTNNILHRDNNILHLKVTDTRVVARSEADTVACEHAAQLVGVCVRGRGVRRARREARRLLQVHQVYSIIYFVVS